MHLYIEQGKLPKAVVPYPFEKHSKGYQRVTHVDHTTGSVHQAVGVCELQPNGSVDYCLHTNEEGIYVIEGELELLRDRNAFRLSADDYALVPYGVPHAYRNRGDKVARWFEISVPQPNPPGTWQDTFFFDADWPKEVVKPNTEDPRIQLVGHFNEETTQSFASGVSTGRRGFRTYQFMGLPFGTNHFLLMRGVMEPGGDLGPHDHPVEEWYCSLSGELDFMMEGKLYHLKPGDVTWTGVRAMHRWQNKGKVPYHWIETHAPEMPRLHAVRHYPFWEKL
jgi:mannose-6-phosphate isomerase-like protein (cupin superfamily)